MSQPLTVDCPTCGALWNGARKARFGRFVLIVAS